MDKLEVVVEALDRVQLPGEMWVDGSFVTEKIDAGDVDVVFHGTLAPAKVDITNADHVAAIRWLISNLKASHLCDSYTSVFAPGDPNQPGGWQYWQNTFGYSRGRIAKGIVVLTLGSGL